MFSPLLQCMLECCTIGVRIDFSHMLHKLHMQYSLLILEVTSQHFITGK
jgi:hypothetical protein